MLVVARHGRTAWNAEGRFQGWADVALDAEGRRQSARLAADLAADPVILGTGPVDRVWSSDLRRSRETADAVAAALGATVSVDRSLREVDVGPWEGLTLSQVRERFPEQYRAWSSGPEARRELRRGGGETLGEAGSRVADAIWAKPDPAGPATIVVGHGMALQTALDLLAERGLIDLLPPAPHLGNAEYLLLNVRAGGSLAGRAGAGP